MILCTLRCLINFQLISISSDPDGNKDSLWYNNFLSANVLVCFVLTKYPHCHRRLTIYLQTLTAALFCFQLTVEIGLPLQKNSFTDLRTYLLLLPTTACLASD